jgi:ribosome recycling factor
LRGREDTVLNESLELAEQGMEKAMEPLRKELSRIRTGRATPALLDGVMVEAYGTKLPLNQVATVSVGDARLLVIKPYDRNVIADIERGINAASLGVNPQSDGVIVRVPLPALTEERRKQLAKQIGDMGEEAKIGIRQARRDANELLKEAKKDREISEDDLEKGLDRVQEITDAFIAAVDQALDKKRAEVMED